MELAKREVIAPEIVETDVEENPLIPLINQLSFVAKDTQLRTFEQAMNWAQRELLDAVWGQMREGKPVRVIILKARQLGISTVVTALMFVMAFMVKRMKGMIISHENDSSTHLLGMVQTFWDTYPFRELYSTKYAGMKHLQWNETHSRMRVATAKNVKAGRSTTIQFLHASEVAFWDDPETLVTGLNQSIPLLPLTFQFLESTANGLGNYFNKEWDKAETGQSSYIALFFPWWRHPEYIMYNVPVPGLDAEEVVVSNFLAAKGIEGEEVTARLAWRRYAIADLCRSDINTFHQEYPTTPEEAFISTGHNIFPLEPLQGVFKKDDGWVGRLFREGQIVRFVLDPTGPLRIFKAPSSDIDRGQYVVSGDATRTTVGDYACAQVINRRTWEQVAVFRKKMDPNTFAEQMELLGVYYNRALLAPEIEGPGYGTVAVLLNRNYPFIWKRKLADKTPGIEETRWGWSSTNKTKPEAVGNLLKAVLDGNITIHDQQTFNEMRNFIDLGNGEFGNSDKEAHDDTVTALYIAITVTMYEALSLPPLGEVTAKGGSNVLVNSVKAGVRAPIPDANSPMEDTPTVPWENWGT